jgi:hypothetical protein
VKLSFEIKKIIERFALDNIKNNNKFLGILGSIPVFFLLSFIWFILVASLICRAEYCSYKYYDCPAWTNQDAAFLIICAILIMAVVILFYIMSKHLIRYDRKHVIFTTVFLSITVQILFVLFFPAKQFADQDIVNRIAYEVIEGNFQAFDKTGYLYQYPNNIGITLLLSIIYRIFPYNMMVPKLLNIAFSTVTSILIFKIYEELFSQSKNNFGILILSCFFPPMNMLNNLVYNDIYATTLFLGAVYCSIKFTKSKSWYSLLFARILLTAGNFLRQVGALFLLAILLYFIIEKVSIIKSIAFFCLVMIACRVPLFLVNYYLIENEKITEQIGLNSAPIHMWIHMGMNEEKFGYWDDSASYNIYICQGQYSKERSRQIYRSLINKRIKEKGFNNLATVYTKKNIWLWTEGTYQAEYYGVGSWGHLYPTIATTKLDSSVRFRDSIRWSLHVINILMFCLIFVGLINCVIKKTSYRLLLPAIVVIGFICFYTIWEIKPRYIYPIYPYLILMAYYGVSIVTENILFGIKRFKKLLKSRK